MNGYLRQSTASQSRLIGPFIDDTDFVSPLTGLTIANTDVKLRANGTTLSNKNSGGGTHQVNGMYSLTWDATDTANVGELFYSVVVSGALSVFGVYVVLEEAVYDQLFAASAPGAATVSAVAAVQTDVTSIQADTDNIQTRLPAALVSGRMDSSVGAMANNVITTASINDGALTAAKAASGFFDAVWSVAARTLTAFGFSVTVGTNNDKTGYSIGNGGITANSLTDSACEKISDALLGRNQSGGSNTGFLVQDSLKSTRNRVIVGAGVAVVYEEDGVTPAFTYDVTTAASNPLSEVNPS